MLLGFGVNILGFILTGSILIEIVFISHNILRLQLKKIAMFYKLTSKFLTRFGILLSTLAFFTNASALQQVGIYNYALVPAKVNIIYNVGSHDTLYLPPAGMNKDVVEPSFVEVPYGHYEQHHKHISRWFKYERPRGAKLVVRIDVDFEGGNYKVNNYESSGTGYSRFAIMQRDENRFRVMSADEIKQEVNGNDMSPGFKIHNRSTIPLTVSLDQVGCLYYQNNLKPGETFDRDTGAVWFTIRAKLYDSQHLLDNLACAEPVAEFVASAIIAAVTAGVGGAAIGAAEAGAEVGAEAAAASTARAMATAALKKFGMSGALAGMGAAAVARYQANTSAHLTGAYAGPPFPFRCTHKPEYEIVGGPALSLFVNLKSEAEAKEVIANALTGDYPLKIRKIGGCQ